MAAITDETLKEAFSIDDPTILETHELHARTSPPSSATPGRRCGREVKAAQCTPGRQPRPTRSASRDARRRSASEPTGRAPRAAVDLRR